jgi:predicted nucleic acid-binding protein
MSGDTFLLDTNVVSDSSKVVPSPTIAAWLKRQNDLALPFPVILEVETGIADLWTTDPARASKLLDWFDEVLAADYHRPTATPEVARLLAKLYSCPPLKRYWQPVKEGKKPGQDLFIAALAVVYDMPIATMDHRDFVQIHAHCPLPGVYNPNLDLWAIPRTYRRTPQTISAAAPELPARRGGRIAWIPSFRRSKPHLQQLVENLKDAEATDRQDHREREWTPTFR